MRSLWFKALLAIAAIWLVAGGVIFWAQNAKPTPESVERYLNGNPLEGKSASARADTVEEVAEQLNGLAYEERRDLRRSRRMDDFFRSLTPEEQARFLDLTLPTGFKQMMDAFNNMEPERRKRFVRKALEDMQERQGEEPERSPRDDEHAQRMVQQGLKSYYSDASADTKMDLAPLIEQMQKNLQWGSR